MIPISNIYVSLENSALATEFQNIFTSTGISRSNINSFIKKHYPDLYNEIERRTIKLNQYKKPKCRGGKIQDISIFERIFCLTHNLDDRPFCRHCKINRVHVFMPYENRYSEYCSHLCQLRSDTCRAKAKATKIAKYGEGNSTNAKKGKQTRLERYGAYHPEYYAIKVKATKLSRHGAENYVNAEKLRKTFAKRKADDPDFYVKRLEKSKQTKIANGHDSNWNNREKFKRTISGFSHTKKSSIISKRKATCLSKYGVESPMQNPSISAKAKDTVIEKYGVSSSLLTPNARQAMATVVLSKAWDLFEASNRGIIPCISKADFIAGGVDVDKTLVRWRCKKCGHEFFHVWRNWNKKCPKCFPQNYSVMQNELADFIESICRGQNVLRNTRRFLKSGRELDVLVECKRIAVEFNGLFWHSSDANTYSGNRISKSYHHDKTAECVECGIRLVHVFEDEWLWHRKLCESKLKKIFNAAGVWRLPAGHCSVDTAISQEFKEKFLNKYSFYGPNDRSSWQCALRYNGHAVALLTASRMRRAGMHGWQIMSYVEVNSIVVEHGFAKLLGVFIESVKPSVVCMRVSSDWNIPEDFSDCIDFIRSDPPQMFWSHCQTRIKGTAIVPANAAEKLSVYDKSKSFLENMNANRFYRIYDSGTLVFEKRLVY